MAVTIGLFEGRNEAPQARNARRGRPKKDPFEIVPDEFKDKTVGQSVAELKTLLSEVAMREMENRENLKMDQHVAEKQEELKDAKAQYVEASKMNKAKMAWLKALIEDKGGN